MTVDVTSVTVRTVGVMSVTVGRIFVMGVSPIAVTTSAGGGGGTHWGEVRAPWGQGQER